MIGRRIVRALAIALTALTVTALPASAQITTGSVAGTVKDAQGGVIPGATATLISETKGTRSSAVVTGAQGDFVFVNVAPGHLHARDRRCRRSRPLKRAAIPVNPGSRTTLEALTLEVGGTSEVIDVKGESPIIQATSGERSFTISTEAVENLPMASRSFIALALLAPGVSGTVADARRAPAAAATRTS